MCCDMESLARDTSPLLLELAWLEESNSWIISSNEEEDFPEEDMDERVTLCLECRDELGVLLV